MDKELQYYESEREYPESFIYEEDFQKKIEFQLMLKEILPLVANEEQTIEAEVRSALACEGLPENLTSMLMEMVNSNPELKAEALHLADDILKANLQ